MWLAPALLAALAWGADDTKTQLQALSSGSLTERQAAERWLASHLTHEDYPLVASFAGAADAEARTRLAQALGASDAHLELAAFLAADDSADARRAGDAALRQMVRRWSGLAQLAPKGGEELWDALAGRFEGVFAIDVGAARADEVLECLARRAPVFLRERGAEARIELVLDPPLFESLARSAPPAAGAWSEGAFEVLLRDLVRSRRAYVDAFVFEGAAPWLWVHSSPAASDLNGADLLRLWCRNVLAGRERVRGEAAARALGQCGWPAPIPWLSRLWLESGDRNALAGLLVAAGRGRVAPQLIRADAVRGLLAEFERRESEAPGPSVERFRREFALALARFPALDVDGVALWELVARWTEADGASWARVACGRQILAGMRRAPPAWRARLTDELSRPLGYDETLSALRLSAALERERRPAWNLAVQPSLLDEVLARRTERLVFEWSEWLTAAPPSDATARARVRALAPPQRALWIEWVLAGHGAVAPVAEMVREWAQGDAPLVPLAERLAERVRTGDGARVAQILQLARADAQGPALERCRRLSLLSGTTPMLERQRWFEELSARSPIPAGDWPLLGALAYQGPTPVYAEFVLEHAKRAASVDSSLESPWSAAFAQAVRGVQARGDAVLAERMRRELLGVLRRSGHPLQGPMERGEWPRPPGPAPIVLDVAR